MTHDDFLDPGTAERLLDGTVAPADAPPGFGPVADLLDAARGGVTPPAADLGALASAARAGAAGSDAPESPNPGRPPVLAKFLTLKAAAVAGVVLLGATSAAAATGALPGPLQRTAHSTLSHVGVTLPSDDDGTTRARDRDATEAEDESTSTTTTPSDPAGVPPTVPTTAPGAVDDHGTEVEHESGDDHGQDPAEAEDESGDDHGGTTATTQPSGGGSGSQESGDDHEDGDHSGSGGSGSGSSGHGGSDSSGHGGGED